MFAHVPISFRTDYALNVVSQKILEIHTKHRYFSLPARILFRLIPPACQLLNEPIVSMPHSSQQLSSVAESSRAQFVRD